ncbi:MAG: hypothetical protein WCT77_01545 [Bacteroidota bacterium]
MQNYLFKYFLLIILGISLALSSCEETIEGVTMPYVEQLVIQGVLEKGKTAEVRISKTMPPLSNPTIEDAEIKNAVAFITVDSIKYTLNYTSKGYYKNDSLSIVSGKNYNLEVSWNGKKATAVTTVPEEPVITNLERKVIQNNAPYGYMMYNIQYFAIVSAQKNTVYLGGRTDFANGNLLGMSYPYNSASMLDAGATDNNLKILLISDYSDTDSLYYERDNSYYYSGIFVESYDPQFNDYYKTHNNGQGGNDIFGMQGTNVKWNIKGEGIGLFIGRAVVNKMLK